MTESANICRSLDKREFVTNHSFNCKGKCSKYLFICVKSTSANCKRFGLIWNSEWESDSFLDGVSFIFVDKTDPIDPNKQKLYWRQTLKLRVSRMTVKPIFYMFYAIYLFHISGLFLSWNDLWQWHLIFIFQVEWYCSVFLVLCI